MAALSWKCHVKHYSDRNIGKISTQLRIHIYFYFTFSDTFCIAISFFRIMHVTSWSNYTILRKCSIFAQEVVDFVCREYSYVFYTSVFNSHKLLLDLHQHLEQQKLSYFSDYVKYYTFYNFGVFRHRLDWELIYLLWGVNQLERKPSVIDHGSF